MNKYKDFYELGALPFDDLSAVQATFDNLPPDQYVDDSLRSRRYSCYYFRDGKLEQLPTKDFMQTYDVNKALGDVDRTYAPIEAQLSTNPIFLKMFDIMLRRCQINENSVIEVHQIRWHCTEDVKEPAPEGNHQDGFDYLGMFMANNHNVDGGEIMLFDSSDGDSFFKRRFDNGEYLLVNDRHLFHNASPLIPTNNDEEGHWDIFVLTTEKRA
ncbi:MAG: 2OG-Fe dioxygenase family protein [Rickettsiales bacterium]|nr:2OG-Fe dioxygenase family protein [Rickettsiales bacterium]